MLPFASRWRTRFSLSESIGFIDDDVVGLPLFSAPTVSEAAVGSTGFSVEFGSVERMGRCDSEGFIDGTGRIEGFGRFAGGNTVAVMIA